MSIIIGIDHGYYAIKTAHCSFPAGLTSYGEHEPYTRQGLLEFGGCFFVCGTGRQPIQRDKTVNDNYYLLTLAAIAKEIRQRGLPPECSVRIAAGLPLTSFGRDKPKFKDYLLRSNQPVNFKFEGVEYSITIEEVAVFPQGYAALMTETGLLQDEPSMLLMDLGGWTVDLMRIDNAIPAADTAHSLELGMIRCVDDIREQVRRETGLSLTDAQIENMLAGQSCTVRDRLIAEAKGVKFKIELSSDAFVYLPEGQLKKAISNILSNAVNYTEAGQSILVVFDKNKLSVSNECSVLPPEQLQHIFEPFYRPDLAHSQATGGNGLGLYIVQTILDKLRLKYQFVPMPNDRGMSFTIQF